MGCDIHGVVQAQVHDWYYQAEGVIDIGPLLERDYHTFGNLFGVRGVQFDEWPKIKVHEGLPEGFLANFGIEELLWEDGKLDAHSPHWVVLEELEKIPLSTYPEDWQFLLRLMQILRDQFDGRPVRLVVWFDN